MVTDIDNFNVYRAEPVPGWRENVHLNGTVYYHHPERRIVTSYDVTKPGVADRIISALNNLKLTHGCRDWDLADEEKYDIEHVAYHLGDPAVPLFYHVNSTTFKKLSLTREKNEISRCSTIVSYILLI